MGDTGDPGARGPVGPTGKDGVDGKDGADGRDGVDGASGLSVRASTLCQAAILQNGVLAYTLRYNAIEYDNGDVFVSCSVSTLAGQYAGSTFYDSKQVGATNEGCVVGADVDDPGFGFWNFELGASGYSAEYVDTGSPNDGFLEEFVGADSSHNGCTTRAL